MHCWLGSAEDVPVADVAVEALGGVIGSAPTAVIKDGSDPKAATSPSRTEDVGETLPVLSLLID